jgi:hypothetical protein
MLNYKKWIIYTAIGLSCSCFIYLMLVFYFYSVQAKDIFWIHHCMVKKEKISRSIKGAKLVFGGGSATLFGIRTKDIQDKLGVPCVNMAIHQGLQIDYQLYNLKKVLQKGDIVILPLEYSCFIYNGDLDGITIGYVITYDKEYLKHIPTIKSLKYIASVSPMLFLDSIQFIKRKEIKKFYDSSNLNAYGDETSNGDKPKIGPEDKSAPAFGVPSNSFNKTKGLEEISKFNVWCRQHGIMLYVTYANTLYFKEYDNHTYRNYFDNLTKYFADHNILTIGKPTDFFFNEDLFYDTNYHLNQKGVTMRTQQLINMLEKVGIADHLNHF